jgi:tRNA pseudouridine55 synthase
MRTFILPETLHHFKEICNNAGMTEQTNAIRDKAAIILDKKIGETPLECLERFRASKIAAGFVEFSDMPMTYAGRLDPMASGKLVVLTGEDCKRKQDYLGLDKEYEVEILFGIDTDTHDILGRISRVDASSSSIVESFQKAAQKYVGTFRQAYPAYSSKTVDGKQLHAHARGGTLPDESEMPHRMVTIYSIEKMEERKLSGVDIARTAVDHVSKVTGDFRQAEIIHDWSEFGMLDTALHSKSLFSVIKIRVVCGNGTYMRSLAKNIGTDIGVGAIAFSIKRTKIGEF